MRYALPAKKLYPIETVDQIKTAAAYFDKYLNNFHPAERVAIADCLEKRASELGMFMENPWIYNYSRRGNTYSPEFSTHMTMRKEACAGKKIFQGGKQIDAQDLLEKISALKPTIKPMEMIDLISDFDKKADLVNSYDRRVRDPFFTVYGSAQNPMYDLKKVASGMYEKELESAVHNESFISKLAEHYGKDFADGFKQDPTNVYASMPVPDKQNIVNLAKESEDE